MSPDSRFFTNRAGLRLHFLRWGDPSGVPLVLLHGLRAYAQTWESLVEALGGGYCIYALDQRGRGLSDWAPAASYHTQSYVEDLEDLIAHVDLQRFVLLGHSLGGANALEYARQHPGRLDGLIIEDIGPGSSSQGDGAARIRREMGQTPLHFDSWEAARAFWKASRPGLSEQGLASRLTYSMQKCDGVIAWRHDQQGIAEARLSIEPTDLWPAVRALDCPSLFIRGSCSDFLPPTALQAMRASNSHVRTVEVADASHYVHDDQGAVFNALVADFLASLARSE
ncbi:MULTISPECIES: alpha/beta fold hydrolase [Pseudomonas]|uniref:alpha/beta fold hydrolase n=1 Tax=Pseudomonas TaxID=286 RepID=UPI000F55C84F|nr:MULTISPECIES: alpha/beta hydrolase [Pseudomonas]AZF15549.1 Hydrolase, alpha/beta fold family functionally coupled to Phosphoribulokinase [Pseudomonas sp. R3-18-08]AZF20862.1 Hydrolase, alpha/beta fold family functionally coupled to Phosphoribulokinase [Pseudomonas sp. R3-52-08]AZF26193.1 Hydrolase, alpha/beta fold family functionally coupled to Phosphoribulokinase [Pseudomonas sp. R2-60-08W]AZF31558.1 Hydrolase, alpha/beta fold family functionally coupled to Phosphoribulokinase [Pseudomonas 